MFWAWVGSGAWVFIQLETRFPRGETSSSFYFFFRVSSVVRGPFVLPIVLVIVILLWCGFRGRLPPGSHGVRRLEGPHEEVHQSQTWDYDQPPDTGKTNFFTLI